LAYDIQMKCDPTVMPLKPAILILAHKRKRQAFISYSTNARGRAAVLASTIRHGKSHLRNIPEGEISDFTLMAVNIGLEKTKANATVEKYQRKFEREGYKLFGGARSALPKITLNGKRLSIVEAMAAAKTKSNYQTVYRRIQRGWPIKEALELS
jgi:hypothetical protein